MVKDEIGAEFTAEYSKLPRQRYYAGQYVDVFDPDTKQKTARFLVLETDGRTVRGRVTNTYGHKRKT